MKSLAPRDIVAKAIDTELKKSGDEDVLLDITHRDRDFIIGRFPNIYKNVSAFGIDITRDPIPVLLLLTTSAEACRSTIPERTNIERLFACGEGPETPGSDGQAVWQATRFWKQWYLPIGHLSE